MTIKSFASAAVLALAATVAHADVSGSFANNASNGGALFYSDAGLLSLSVMSPFTGSSGYDIYTVSLDGSYLTDLIPASDDYYSLTTSIGSGLHSILVTGKSYGGSYSGAYSVTAVPEPESLALAVAGLAIVGGLTRRRLK